MTGKGGGVGSNQYGSRGTSRAGVKTQLAPHQTALVNHAETSKTHDFPSLFRYARPGGLDKVRFHSLERDYVEEYVKEHGGNLADIQATSVKLRNPLVIDSPDNKFSDPGHEKPFIEHAIATGRDGVVFKNHGDRFVVEFPTRKRVGRKTKPHNLSIDAVPTLHINRQFNPTSSPTPPDVPNADELADETIRYLETVLREIEDRLAAGQPIGDLAQKLDQLVAQAELSSWIAGAVGVWHDSHEPRLYTLDVLGGIPTRRFPWLEVAARWLMDRNVYSANEIQAQARGEFEPRWKSLEAVTLVRDEIASGFTVGESFEQFYARIKDKVAATKPELQNAFRTSTHQAYIVGTTNTLEKPLVRLQFPFVIYRSAWDTRTRDTHRALDGLLFAVGSAEYDLARRALNDFNCRCTITSYTAKKAAAKKLVPVTMDQIPRDVRAKYGQRG